MTRGFWLFYVNTARNVSQLCTPEARAKAALKIKEKHASGGYDYSKCGKKSIGRKHTDASKALVREKALASPHRRLVRSIRQYTMLDGSVIFLDSSWEEYLALKLDEHGIRWERPSKPIKWTDSKGHLRNYFPDFYLADFDLFVDPKNPYAAKSQQEKVDWLLANMDNIRILTSLEEMDSFINALISAQPSKLLKP